MDAPTARTDNKASTELYSDEELRDAMELLFFSYRDFIREPDAILEEYNFGRAHHRVIHFVGRNPDITVTHLLSILRITKQSLSRVLSQLVRENFIQQLEGPIDRRQRLLSLTQKGYELEDELSRDQRNRITSAFVRAGPEAVNAFYKVLLNMMNNSEEFKQRAGT
jgi:DNA-binding MarR family transcriptional regulator